MKRTIVSAARRLCRPTLGSAWLAHGLARFFSLAPDRSLTAAKPIIANGKKRQLLIAILLTAVLTVTGLPYSLIHSAAIMPARAAAASNPITTENAQPGSTGWQFDTDSTGGPLEAANHEIEGYASATSVNKGNQISFKVSLSSSAQYTMQVYRMGYYPTGTNPDGDKIIEFGICLFEYDRQSGRIYKVLGSWEWFEDPGFALPPEITNITGITDEMVAGHRIEDQAVDVLLSRLSHYYHHHQLRLNRVQLGGRLHLDGSHHLDHRGLPRQAAP